MKTHVIHFNTLQKHSDTWVWVKFLLLEAPDTSFIDLIPDQQGSYKLPHFWVMVSLPEGKKCEVRDLQPDQEKKSGGGASWLGMRVIG